MDLCPVEIIIESATSANAQRNIEASFARNLPRFHQMPELGKSIGPVAIVGGGPSLKAELENLRNFPGDVIGCGTVHDYLVTNGIIPKYHVNGEPDADGVMLRWFQYPQVGTKYLLASHCPADIFDALSGYRIYVWHLAVPDPPDFRGESSIPGPHFIIGRAWPLAAILGYKDIHFFGFDCSFPEDCEDQHAYSYHWTKEEPVVAIYRGRRFVTTPGLLSQLEAFSKMRSSKFKVTVHGDSLAASIEGIG